jgi:hypothetical protein
MATGRVPTTANSPLTAKGDLFTYSTTQARLAVGNNGDTLLADSSATTGLRWQGNFAAGKNKIINGDFGIWQRGTSFTPSAAWNYNADRFAMYCAGSGHTPVVSRQTFTPGTAPVAGYEGLYFWRYSQAAAGSGNTTNNIAQRIENVQTFANQQVTLSFWGKADASRTVTSEFYQEFGSGGSVGVTTSIGSHSFTTSWQRFTATVTVPSISGKTVGTNSYLTLQFILPTGVAQTIDIWGLQVEAGSVATAFQTATGTLQGELAACQRYYQRYESSASYAPFGTGFVFSSTQTIHSLPFQVRLRGNPSVSFSAGNTFAAYTAAGTVTAATGTGTDRVGTNSLMFTLSASTGVANGQGCFCIANAGAAAYIEINSEL